MTAQRTQNESALASAAQRHDKEALQLLLERNWAWLKGLVFSIVGDPGEVDDVLQDICVRVIGKIETLREPERFRPWLAVLARRQALRHRQQRAARPAPLSSTLFAEDEELARFRSDEKVGESFSAIENREQCRKIWQAVQSLPEKYRQVFVLQYAGDLTYGQIAEVLDVPLTTVQIRLVRARRMICDRVAGEDRNKVRERQP
ncbi:MAG: RNA polymerase sigma factor [Phycisphaerales bacterium]|nr:MAG: RNA polymerase sigma factor [Phycisphaerales bacterium]